MGLMQQLLIRRKTLYMILAYILICTTFYIFGYSENVNKLIAVTVMLLSFYFFIKSRKSLGLMITSFFIAYSNYSICVGIYLFPEMRPKYLYPQIQDIDVYGIGILMILLFLLTLINMIPFDDIKSEGNKFFDFIQKDNYNSLLCFINIVAFFAVILIGYTPSVGGRGTSSPLYEYGIIFLIIAFYFSGKKKIWKYMIFGGGILYSLMSFFNGTRIEALSCIFLLLLLGMKNRISFYKFWGGAIIGIAFFQIIGVLRGNYSNIEEMCFSAISDLIDSKLVFNTCTHAFFPALCMIDQFKTFSLIEALHYLGCFLLTVVFGVNRVEDGNLIAHVREIYYHNNGGLSLGFFYVWFGYLGSLICGVIVSAYFRLLRKGKIKWVELRQCCVIYLIISVPRWYLYGPWAFSRGILICALAFCVMASANQCLKKIRA